MIGSQYGRGKERKRRKEKERESEREAEREEGVEHARCDFNVPRKM